MGNGTGDIEDLLERAYESEDAGEIEELVERALELDPENPEVLLLQAITKIGRASCRERV